MYGRQHCTIRYRDERSEIPTLKSLPSSRAALLITSPILPLSELPHCILIADEDSQSVSELRVFHIRQVILESMVEGF